MPGLNAYAIILNSQLVNLSLRASFALIRKPNVNVRRNLQALSSIQRILDKLSDGRKDRSGRIRETSYVSVPIEKVSCGNFFKRRLSQLSLPQHTSTINRSYDMLCPFFNLTTCLQQRIPIFGKEMALIPQLFLFQQSQKEFCRLRLLP